MQSVTVFKMLHRSITVSLLLLVAGYGLFLYYTRQPPDDDIYMQKQLTPDMYLYVTKYKGGGATVSNVYRYYLGAKQSNPLAQIENLAYFMTADTGNAQVTGYGAHVNVIVKGKIFSFTNSALFYSGGVAIMPVISLNSTYQR